MSNYLLDLFGLRGKTAVVVGGTGVLCGRMCHALAAAGAQVVVAGRDADRGEQRRDAILSEGGRAWFLPVDVTSRDAMEDLCAQCHKVVGPVDILVNGAGVNSAVPYFEIQDASWHQILDANLTSVHRACQIFAKGMVERGSGSIINIASISALVPLSRVFAYSASKSAVVNYTQNLARELGPSGVRVNSLCPGFFPAEQNRQILDADRLSRILAHTPVGRLGEPSELDGVLLLLASDRAGRFITGANYVVDGGFATVAI